MAFAASLVAVFLVVLLVAGSDNALFISPLIAFTASVMVFFGAFQNYERNRKNAGAPIEKAEIDRWVAKSLLVSVPVFVLCISALASAVSSGEIPSMYHANFIIFAFASFFAVMGSVARCLIPFTQSLASELSRTQFGVGFKTWLDVKD